MKAASALLVLLLVLSGVGLHAQQPRAPQKPAPQVPQPPDIRPAPNQPLELPVERESEENPYKLLDKAWKKLVPGGSFKIKNGAAETVVHLHLNVSHVDVVNAWAYPQAGEITITQNLLDILGSAEGEVAFILAHEIGHVLSYQTGWGAQIQKQQMDSDLSNFLNALGWLALTPKEESNRRQQLEERLADTLGLDLMASAGYNPYDAGALFGRLQMYEGTTDPAARQWDRYRYDHPFNEERIENLRRVMSHLQETTHKQGTPSRPVATCPSGYIRVYTRWIERGEPAESGCVSNTSLAQFGPDLKCPPGYIQTAVTEPPHNDICVSERAQVLRKQPEQP